MLQFFAFFSAFLLSDVPCTWVDSMANENNVTELIFTGLFQDTKVQKVCFVLFLLCTWPHDWATNLLFWQSVPVRLCILPCTSSSAPCPWWRSATPLQLSLSSLLTYLLRLKPSLWRAVWLRYSSPIFGGCGWDSSACRNGLWPLHGHLQISSLHEHHELSSVSHVGGWFLAGAFIYSIIQVLITIPLPFCGPNVIDHYFCDLQPLFKLACTDTFMEGVVVMANSGLISIISLLILVSSYAIILISLRKHSAEGRRKALSTCASHIIVVILYFGPAIFLYMRPSSSLTADNRVSVF